MKAVILAGGKGTRLKSITASLPKPMVSIGNKPLLLHHIELLKKHGITDIILLTGYLGALIQNYLQDGSKFGVSLSYVQEQTPLGTAGALASIKHLLQEDFIVFYGDIMINMDIDRFRTFHKEKKSIATLVVHPNDHPYDSDLIELDANKKIKAFYPKPHMQGTLYSNMVNAAAYLFSPKFLQNLIPNRNADLGQDIFPRLVGKIPMYGYNTSEYLKDIGTPDRLSRVNADYHSGKIAQSSFHRKQKAIFIDRDGVINKEVGLLHTYKDFELLDKVIPAIKMINASEYLAIVVTNQPVVARNLCTLDELNLIHKKMETLLGNEGAKLDMIYYCPHHPDTGFPEENKQFKRACFCRKPSIGMIRQAALDFNLNLSASFIIGDDDRDIACGINAGLTPLAVKRNGISLETTIPTQTSYHSLYDAVHAIISQEKTMYVSPQP